MQFSGDLVGPRASRWTRFASGLPKWKSWLRSDLLFSLVLGIAFFLLLRSTPDIPGGDDGYRHVKFASRLIRDPHAALLQPWKLVYFWPNPVDVWFGYHLLLAPFTLAASLITAAKALAAVVYGAMVFVMLAILRDLGAFCRKAWVFLAATGSGMALYRASLARPYLLSILLVLLVTHFTLRRKPLAVGIASAAHALSYSIFFLAAFAPAVYVVLRRDKMALRIGIGCLLGLAAGLACNPYFPENVRFALAQAFVPLNSGPRLTMEFLPLNMEWINPSWPVVGVWIAAMLRTVWLWRKRKLEAGPLLLLGMSLAAFAGSIQVGRTFDYFVPLAVLGAAAVISPWILESRRNRVDAAGVATVLFVLCALNVAGVYRAMAKTPQADRFRGASEYLLANGHGAVVFNTQWEQYPFLYFWNSRNTYIVGIEPSLMLHQDARRYWLWRHIANDEPSTCGQPRCGASESRSIDSTVTAEFGAGFVILEHDKNPRLEALLGRDAAFREVYHDDACAVFAVRN